jgi:hypothetical protein
MSNGHCRVNVNFFRYAYIIFYKSITFPRFVVVLYILNTFFITFGRLIDSPIKKKLIFFVSRVWKV